MGQPLVARTQVGIIGGSGLYAMDGLRVIEERTIDTPFGAPSDPFVIGDVGGVRVAFLARPGERSLPCGWRSETLSTYP